jgi:hypothetical protein
MRLVQWKRRMMKWNEYFLIFFFIFFFFFMLYHSSYGTEDATMEWNVSNHLRVVA